MAYESRHCALKRRGASGGTKSPRGFGGNHCSAVKQNDAVGNFFYFAEGVRCEKERVAAAADKLVLQEPAKFRSGQRVKTACRLIEQQNGWPMEQGARQAEPVRDSRGESAHLAIEFRGDAHPLSRLGNPLARVQACDVVHGGKKGEVFTRGQASVEAFVTPSVIPELRPGARSLSFNIETAESRPAARRDNQRSEDAQQSRFPGAIGTDESYGFAPLDSEADARERTLRGPREWVQ